MTTTANRDAVIDAYIRRAGRRDPNDLVGPALRTRSRAIRDLLVQLAAGERLRYDEFALVVDTSQTPPDSMLETATRRRWLLALARLLAAQNLEHEDRPRARLLFDAVFDHFSADVLDADHQAVYAQLLFLEGAHDRIAWILPDLERLPDVIGHYLRCDLANPFVDGAQLDRQRWLELISQPFVHAGLEPLTLQSRGGTPFDGLSAEAKPSSVTGPLVTVIMTAFQPDDSLHTAVRSILGQTWADLELIVVDDASGKAFDDYFQACLDLDPRVSLVRRDVNGGTYLGRNVALDQARGDYVTFQDSDDWSHPRRLESQLTAIMGDPSVLATHSLAVRARPDLTHQWLGYAAQRVNASSLMFRRQPVLDRIGYFDSVRKGADAEYAARLEAAFGRRIRRVRQPLAYTRLHGASLSRSDFSLGWSAPARIAHQAAYLHWHCAITDGASPYRSPDPKERPFPVPAAFLDRVPGAPTPRQHYDVVLLGDWLPHSGPHDAALDEIVALADEGFAVGIAHLESHGMMTAARKQISRQVQQVVNDGTADRVLLTEPVWVALLVVRDPSVLQFPPAEQPALSADQVVVVARRTPGQYPALALAYDRATCQANARAMFGTDPVWLAGSETAAGTDRPQQVLLAPVVPRRWEAPSGVRSRGARAVVGMYDNDTETYLVGVAVSGLVRRSASESRTTWSRVLRRASRLSRRAARTAIRPTWDIRERQKRAWREYLDEINFLACFPLDDAFDASVEVMVRAMAAGVVVLAPERFRDVLADAAVYCTRGTVRAVIRQHHNDSEMFRAQVDRGLDYVAKCYAPSEFVKRIQELAGSGNGATDGT